MKTLGVALTLMAVGIIGSFLFETPTQAASSVGPVVTVGNVPLPVTGTITDSNAGTYTHVGQKSSQVVNLRFTNNQPATRIDPATGNPDGTPFEVPNGFVFVLTDLHASPICTQGQSVLYILLQDVSGSQVFRDRKASVCPSTGDGSNERHYSTGLLFGAGSRLVAAMSPTVDHFLQGEGYLVPTN